MNLVHLKLIEANNLELLKPFFTEKTYLEFLNSVHDFVTEQIEDDNHMNLIWFNKNEISVQLWLYNNTWWIVNYCSGKLQEQQYMLPIEFYNKKLPEIYNQFFN